MRKKQALRLRQKGSEVKKQRGAAANRRRNKKIINYAIVGIVVLVIALGGYAQLIKKDALERYDDFASCLTTAGAGMYGTEWCPSCQEQKRLFGNSFKYVTYSNCDANPEACENQGVTGYPTWIFADGTRLLGVQTLETLAEKTGCQIG